MTLHVDINPRTWRNHVVRSSWGLTFAELRVSVALVTLEKASQQAPELSPWVTMAELGAMLDRVEGDAPALEAALPALRKRGLVEQDKSGGMPYRWRSTRRLENLLREGMGS